MTVDASRLPTLADVVHGIAQNRPDAPALVCADTRLTHAVLADRTDRLATALETMGVGPGDRIAWLGQNCHRIFEALLAASRLGAILAPLNWRQSTQELEFVLADLDPKVVLWQALDGIDVNVLMGVTAPRTEWVSAHDTGRYEALLEETPLESPKAVTTDAQDPVLVLYTGAFTGRPSGAMLTSSNLLTQGMHLGHLMQIDRSFVYLNAGPLHHIATMMVAIATMEYGGINVVIPRADADLICRAIEDERCTSAFLLPQVAERVAVVARQTGADLSSFRSPLDLPGWSDLVQRDETPWGRSSNGYGQTELSGNVAHGALLGEGPLPLGIGLAAPLMQLSVRNEDGISGAPGSVGEILVRGPLVHAGYWNRPKVNRERFRDGWWHTGDLGRIGEDGRLVFIGPMARLIKSGLENIYPVEVEAAIRDLDGVAEVGVIGVPDERWGQSVRAVVVRAPGSAVAEQDVIAHVASRIASYKKPRSVVFVDGPLPGAGGFIDYDELDRQHEGGGYPSSIRTGT